MMMTRELIVGRINETMIIILAPTPIHPRAFNCRLGPLSYFWVAVGSSFRFLWGFPVCTLF